MTAALVLALAVVLANAGASRAAKVWTDRGDRERRWGKAQAAAAAFRVAVSLAGMGVAWRVTGRPGPVVFYVFAAAVGQLILQVILFERHKI